MRAWRIDRRAAVQGRAVEDRQRRAGRDRRRRRGRSALRHARCRRSLRRRSAALRPCWRSATCSGGQTGRPAGAEAPVAVEVDHRLFQGHRPAAAFGGDVEIALEVDRRELLPRQRPRLEAAVGAQDDVVDLDQGAAGEAEASSRASAQPEDDAALSRRRGMARSASREEAAVGEGDRAVDLQPPPFAVGVGVADRLAAALPGLAQGRLGEGRRAEAFGDLRDRDLDLEAVAPLMNPFDRERDEDGLRRRDGLVGVGDQARLARPRAGR